MDTSALNLTSPVPGVEVNVCLLPSPTWLSIGCVPYVGKLDCSLHTWLGGVFSLECVDWSGVPAEYLPLTEISLAGNNIRYFASNAGSCSLAGLEALQVIDLSGNPQLAWLSKGECSDAELPFTLAAGSLLSCPGGSEPKSGLPTVFVGSCGCPVGSSCEHAMYASGFTSQTIVRCQANHYLEPGDRYTNATCLPCPAETPLNLAGKLESNCYAACPDNSEGESIQTTGCSCKADYYAPDSRVLSCVACPPNAVCAAGSLATTILPEPGYWYAVGSGEGAGVGKMVACLNDACCGAEGCDGGRVCSVGFTGKLCAECEAGYGQAGNDCTACPDSFDVNFILLALLVLGTLVAVSVAACLTVRSQQKPAKVNAALQAGDGQARDSIALLMVAGSFIQFNSGALSLGFPVPSSLSSVLSTGDALMSIGNQLTSYSCAVVGSGSVWANASLLFRLLSILTFCLPPQGY